MSLASRIFLDPEVRVARAQIFYAEARQRTLDATHNKSKQKISPKDDCNPLINNSSGRPRSMAPGTNPLTDSAEPQHVEPAPVANQGAVMEEESGAPAASTQEDPALKPKVLATADDLKYTQYSHQLEEQYLPEIRALISKDLSEPYSIYVYRYFLYQWGYLCYMALDPTTSSLIGVIICKLEPHTSHSPATLRGYIAMLAVSSTHRGKGIATKLVRLAIDTMADKHADEIVLETEETNIPAMRLYEGLGFLRSKKLHRYYLSGSSAYRLVLSLRPVGDGGIGDVDDPEKQDPIIPPFV